MTQSNTPRLSEVIMVGINIVSRDKTNQFSQTSLTSKHNAPETLSIQHYRCVTYVITFVVWP